MDLRRIDLNLLVILDAVLREGHVTRAAQQLSMSQPAVSGAINRLRRLLEDPLLVRTGRTLQCTPFAESLRPKIGSILADIDHALTARPAFDPNEDVRTFSISATDYVTVILLRSVVESLTQHAPKVRIVAGPVHQDYASQLREDKTDLLFLPAEVATSLAGYPGESLFSDRFVLAMCKHHPRVDADPLSLLTEEPYLSWRAHGPSFADRHLRRLEVPLRVEMSTESLMTAPFLLQGTRLVTVIHARLAHVLQKTAGLAIRELPLDVPPVTQRMFWHTRRTADSSHQWLRQKVRDATERMFEAAPLTPLPSQE